MYNRKFAAQMQKTSKTTKQEQVSCREYDPKWAFVLDGDEICRFNDAITHVVKANASGIVKSRMSGMKLGDIDLNGKRLMTIHEVFDSICDIVGEDSVTFDFGSNGLKLVRNGSKIDNGVDQLSVAILHDLWVDAVIASGGQNSPTAVMAQYGNVFFSIRTMLNNLPVEAEIITGWRDFLDTLRDKFEALKDLKASLDEDEDEEDED